jgi:hypothetical protein
LPPSAAQLPTADSSFRVTPLLVTQTASPGETVSGRLLVVNPADEPLSLSVTPQDFATDSAGADSWHAYGSQARSLEGWMSFAPSYLTLPARGEAFIDYEIRVPARAAGESAPEGSRWSALAVKSDRERLALSRPAEAGAGPSLGVRVALVYAIKIYLTVAGTEQPVLDAVALQGGDQPGSLRATFANRGNVVIRPRVWMEVRSLQGAVLGRVEALKWTLQPRTEHHYRFALRDLPERLPDGRYQVAVIADYGGSHLEGLAAPLVLESGGTAR